MAVLPNYVTFRHYFGDGTTALDGYETFDVGKVRAAGFDGGFTGISKPILAFPITFTVDGSAVGAEEYDVWLSQRTDDGTRQMFSLVATAGYSGSWTLSLTSQGAADLGLAATTDSVSTGNLAIGLRNVHFYCRRISDGAIQWVDLLAETMSNA